MIRTATKEDVADIMSIIDEARITMEENGNVSQWPKGYPAEKTIIDDIVMSTGYVFDEEGCVVAYFAFKPSPDPTYQTIYGGEWIDADAPYFVIHRIASKRTVRGVMVRVLDFCFSRTDNIRIDTHCDNTIMRYLLKKHGFTYCGIIHTTNGSERLAFQRKLVKDGTVDG